MVIYQVSDHHTGSDSSPRKVLPSPFLSPIHHRTTQEVKRKSIKQQDTTYECPKENRYNHCHPSLFLCRANDVPVTPSGSAGFCCSLRTCLTQLHTAALQKNQADLTGVLLVAAVYPSLHQCHGGHGYVYSMLKAP